MRWQTMLQWFSILSILILALYTIDLPAKQVIQNLLPSGWIVFQEGAEGSVQLYRVNADGSHLTTLTHDSFDYWYPTVSPDGAHIAFQSSRAGGWDLFVMDVDGSNVRQITRGVQPMYPASWSPDGTKLAVTIDSDIYVLNVDGSQLTNLTRNPANDWRPAWSPDGSRIAFASDRDHYSNNSLETQIYVMGSDGSSPRRLTNWRDSCTFPAWSPDGNFIAFAHWDDSDYGVYVMSATGWFIHKVSNDGLATAWSPDGLYLAITTLDSNTRTGALSAVQIDTGRVFPIMTLNGNSEEFPVWRK